ncbi:hypothetical protein KVT40_005534 [Elsinoe batatas]|uniref:Uncharacterized protein n=1 Tax=Elsinoe batatas TaxID=2601811 RepID=A0A8K0L1B1_9PEZI|nr:hypothetical protein KVT40_005534 [Elsinoe batatas]
MVSMVNSSISLLLNLHHHAAHPARSTSPGRHIASSTKPRSSLPRHLHRCQAPARNGIYGLYSTGITGVVKLALPCSNAGCAVLGCESGTCTSRAVAVPVTRARWLCRPVARLYFEVWCRPFSQYWAVPAQNHQCSAATNHLITYTVFNLSTDVACLKIAICAIFSVGAFSMLAAILNKYYSFTNPFGVRWTEWYCHESSTNMLVANLPFVYTLLRRVFNLKSLDSTTGKYGTESKIRSWWTGARSQILSGEKGTEAATAVGGTMVGGTMVDKSRDLEKGRNMAGIRERDEDGISLEGQEAEFGMSYVEKGVVKMTVVTMSDERSSEESKSAV